MYRFTVVLLTPIFGLALLIGKPLVQFALGGHFSGDDAQRLVVTFICLSGWVLGSAAGIYAVLALLARGREGALAVVATIHIAALTPLAIVGRELAGIEGIAVAQSLAMLAATAAQLRLAFGSAWIQSIKRLWGATLKGGLAVSGAFAPSFVIVAIFDRSFAATAVAVALAAVLALGVSRLAWPSETAALASVFSRS
jgi:hypothetical protein